MSGHGLLARLPAIDPDEAELRRQLLGALNGRRWRHGPVVASILRTPPDAAPWFHCANGCAFHLSDGAPPIRRAGEGFDGIDAACALETTDLLLADVEAALGIDLAPEHLVAEAPPDVLIVQLRSGADRLMLAWPQVLPVVPAPPPNFTAVLVADVPLALTLGFSGPKLAPHDAASLATGDLLLLGHAPFTAQVEAGDRRFAVSFHPGLREARLQAKAIHQTETPMDDPTSSPAAVQDPAADAAAVAADFAVPLTIELENSPVPLRQLQALREGTVLPIESDGSLPVLVRVSGQRLARGHLVAVGEGFGVLIDQRLES